MAVCGDDKLGIERREFFQVRLDVFSRHERAQKAKALDRGKRGGEKHPLFRQPNRCVGVAVNIVELDQLQSSIAEVNRHAIVKLQVRGNQAKTAKAFAHLARFRDQSFVPFGIIIAFYSGGAPAAPITTAGGEKTKLPVVWSLWVSVLTRNRIGSEVSFRTAFRTRRSQADSARCRSARRHRW